MPSQLTRTVYASSYLQAAPADNAARDTRSGKERAHLLKSLFTELLARKRNNTVFSPFFSRSLEKARAKKNSAAAVTPLRHKGNAALKCPYGKAASMLGT